MHMCTWKCIYAYMHLEMIEPLRLSIVLCAKDTSVEEDK